MPAGIQSVRTCKPSQFVHFYFEQLYFAFMNEDAVALHFML